MVRNASGALSKTTLLLSSRPGSELGRSVLAVSVDSVLEYGRGFEHHPPPRRNRDFFASLGVPSDALTLLAHDERTKRRQLYRLTALKAVGDFLQYQFHKRRRFRARKAYLLVNRLAQIRTCDRFSTHRLPRVRRSKISHCFIKRYSLEWKRSTITETALCRCFLLATGIEGEPQDKSHKIRRATLTTAGAQQPR